MSADDELVASMVEELAGAGPMPVTFAPVTVFQLVGLVQLALRHPKLPLEARRAGERFVTAARGHFADCPAVLDVFRRGDDPHEDRQFP